MMRTEDSLSTLVAQSFLVMAMRECFCGMCHPKAKLARILEYVLGEIDRN